MFSRALALSRWLLFLVALGCEGQNIKPTLSPPSGWVVPFSYDPRALATAPDPAYDTRWLLRSSQINAQNDETFTHDIRQIVTPAGARGASHIVIDYDPSYQTVTFHWLRILRGGAVLNRFNPLKIQDGPAGNEPPRFLFGSTTAAIVTVDDVAPGDILDYAFTIEGSNPALDGKLAARLAMQFQEPVDRLIARVIWPPPRKLYIQNHGTSIEPQTAYRSNRVEFTWELRQVAALRLEPQTPASYDPYPWVQLSEFPSWAGVNHWALERFTVTNAPSPEFDRHVAEWKHLPSPADQVLAALRFVQEALANVGTGYEPALPSVVLTRGQGDSADKARLLAAFLRALKIDAAPVLVNTRRRGAINEWHPSPIVFDHALVRAAIEDVTYWLDPAAEDDQGPLTSRTWPNCGCGLVVRPGSSALSIIPPPPPPRTVIHEYFSVGGMTDDAGLRVVTMADGSDAASLRRQLSTVPRADLERDDLAAFGKAYPDIQTTAPLAYAGAAGDDQLNRAQTVEYYRIQNMWSHLSDETFFHCRLYAAEMKPLLTPPLPFARTMPLAIPYPVHKTVHIEAALPTSILPIPNETQTVESPAFVFRREISAAHGRLVIDFDYRSLTDALAPEDVPAYATQLEAASKLISYTVMSY